MVDFEKYKGKKLCVAVSGGVDSMCLLHFTSTLRERYGFTLVACTCEHGIRGKSSKKDAELVQAYAKELNVPCYTFFENCIARAKRTKESLELTARNFRRESFDTLISEGKADYVLTAHHLEDEAETVLFRLARGTLSGVKGIEEETGVFVRPFLDKTKNELYRYAKEHHVPYREDKTNFKTDATRNVIRRYVLKYLEKAVNGASENIKSFAEDNRTDDEFLYRLSDELIEMKDKTTSADTGFRVHVSNEKPLFTRACLTVLKKLGIEKDYTKKHLGGLYELAKKQTGKEISLPKGITAKRQYDEIAFFKEREIEPIGTFPVKDGETKIGVYNVLISKSFSKDSLQFDLDKLPDTAVIRLKEQGDFIRKFGGGSKPLKAYLVDKKIPSETRNALPLIADKTSHEVYVVCGVDISSTVKTDEKTKEIRYVKTEGENK